MRKFTASSWKMLMFGMAFSLCLTPPVKANGEGGVNQENREFALEVEYVDLGDPAVIVIDNDVEKNGIEITENYQWQDLPDEPGKTKITAGSEFPVAIQSALTSKTAKKGDPVEARLKVDIKIGGKLIAAKGTRVVGRVTKADPARRLLHAELSKKRWMRANGSIAIQFDEIVLDTGEHLPLVARPARAPRIVQNRSEGRVLGVNHGGEIATPLSIQLKHQALHLAIRGAASAGGVFSMGAVPVAYGLIGAMNPDFAFMHPVGKNVPHRRLKGFGMGIVSGLPGGFLIADTIIRGQETVIKPGDQFLIAFHQDFTGEASSEAELLAGSSRKVRGEVIPAQAANN